MKIERLNLWNIRIVSSKIISFWIICNNRLALTVFKFNTNRFESNWKQFTNMKFSRENSKKCKHIRISILLETIACIKMKFLFVSGIMTNSLFLFPSKILRLQYIKRFFLTIYKNVRKNIIELLFIDKTFVDSILFLNSFVCVHIRYKVSHKQILNNYTCENFQDTTWLIFTLL